MMMDNREAAGVTRKEEDYSEIEFYLQKAQDEIGQALSVLSPNTDGSTSTGAMYTVPRQETCVAKETVTSQQVAKEHGHLKDRRLNGSGSEWGYYSLGHPRKKPGLKLDCNRQVKPPYTEQGIVDFHSIFTQSDTFDESFYNGEAPSSDVQLSWNGSSGSNHRPDRPQTLTPPISLPKCCNFRNRDWRFYVSGNFKTDISVDTTECVDPLDSFLSEKQGVQLRSDFQKKSKNPNSKIGYNSESTKQDKNFQYYIPSPLTTSSEENGIVESVDSNGEKVYTYTVSTKIDAPKASSTYQSLSSSTSDGSSSKFPIEIAKRSTDDETDSKLFLSKEDLPKVFDSVDKPKHVSKSVDNIDQVDNRRLTSSENGGSVEYVSKKWIIDSEDTARSSPALNNMEYKSVSSGPVHAGYTTHQEVDCAGDARKEGTCLNVNGYQTSNGNYDGSRLQRMRSPTSPRGIKTNGLLLSEKRTLREKRLRVRSDPSRMLSEQLQHAQMQSGYCTHRVASVQTDSILDGFLSPTNSKRHLDGASSPTDYRSRSPDHSSPERAVPVLSIPPPPDHLKPMSNRQRSISADRVQLKHKRRGRPRDRSESPDRKGSRSPGKYDYANDRSPSKVSRSTQTHRSIIKCGNTKTGAATDVSSPTKLAPSKNSATTIHVQLDDVIRTKGGNNSPPLTVSNVQTPEARNIVKESSIVKICAIKEYISPKAGERHPANSEDKIKPTLPIIKCDNIVKQSATAVSVSKTQFKKSSKNKMTSSVSMKTRIQTKNGEAVEQSTEETQSQQGGHSVIFVPSRESRRLQVRPQMPVIVEDVQKSEDEYSEDTSSTASSHRKSVHYYGSLKTEHMGKSADTIIAASLSKSANDVTEKSKADTRSAQRSSKSLLDSMHRKYYPDQYGVTHKTKSAELLSTASSKEAGKSSSYLSVPKSHTVPHLKSSAHKSSGVTVTVRKMKSESAISDGEIEPPLKSPKVKSRSSSPSARSAKSPKLVTKSPKCLRLKVDGSACQEQCTGTSQISSPSPEEHRGDPGCEEEEFMFECCEHATPECDVKSFQMLMKTDREYAEIEAIEACKWLRAAGFPQYAQMYEEHQFPIDVSSVEKDHDFLDTDSIQSLFRRLNTLNKCASMKIEAPARKSADDSDDEDQCALSDKWRYQRSSRRWSRKDLDSVLPVGPSEDVSSDKLGIRSCSSHDSVITDNEESVTSQTDESLTLQPRSPHSYTDTEPPSGQPSPSSGHNTSVTSGHVSDSDNSNAGSSSGVPMSPTAIKRSASEKFKSAKNSIFKRMESLKSRKGSIKNKQHKLPIGKIEIGNPVLVETKSIQERMDLLGCKEISLSAETSPNLSTSSRNTSSSGAHDVTADSDCVFMDNQSSVNDISDFNERSDVSKKRNYSESAVGDLADMSPTNLHNGFSEGPQIRSPYKYRSSSFSTTNNNYELSAPLAQKSHSELRLEEANNNVEKTVRAVPVSLRQRDLACIENRMSVYDNVPDSEEDSDAVRELDMIVQNLMQDISELNASWGLSESGCGIDAFPLELTLEEALQDLNNSDKENTLTRKNNKSVNMVTDPFDSIPVFPVDGTTNNNTSSRSSSSSTISHSNSSVMTSSHHQCGIGDRNANDSFFNNADNVSHISGNVSRHGSLPTTCNRDLSQCEDLDSSHVHMLGMDDTLDSILRNLECNYGAQRQRLESDTSARSNNVPAAATDTSTELSIDFSTVHSSHYEDTNKNLVPDPEGGEPDPDSASLSNPELSDPDTTPGSREEDGSEDVMESRERRDSGVGSSLTREPSDRRRYRIRWHSFVKSHRPSFNSRDLQINSMSAGQLKLLRKFSLLKITALMEKYSLNRSGWNWAMPMNKFIRRFKVTADYKDKNVFGVPLQIILQRTGQALPQCILHAMRCLRKNAHDAVGIFRKSGVRSRIQKLRDQIEAEPESVSFDTLQAYDVADLLKQYFRELPECLLTNKLSETFISIFTHVPTEQRQEALYAAVMLLPDENREVLQSLLLFLSDMADYAKQNQMNASNLAVCFAPSLFHLCGSRTAASASPKRNRKKDGIPDQRELQEQKAAHECLTEMIIHCKKIFMVPGETLRMCHFSYMDQCSPVGLDELGRRRQGDDVSEPGDYMSYLESCIQGLLKESRDKFKGWVSVSSHTVVDLAYKKIDDGYSLRLWKCSVEIEAPPCEVLNRVCRERQMWDEDFLKWRVVEALDQNTEVFQYMVNSMAPHPARDFCELRHWRTDLPKGACILVSTSVQHNEAPQMGGVTGVCLASRYLIEHCGSGKSRLTHISRVDLRGHTPEWYNKVYGHLCANYTCRIRDSFSQKADGPETNV